VREDTNRKRARKVLGGGLEPLGMEPDYSQITAKPGKKDTCDYGCGSGWGRTPHEQPGERDWAGGNGSGGY